MHPTIVSQSPISPRIASKDQPANPFTQPGHQPALVIPDNPRDPSIANKSIADAYLRTAGANVTCTHSQAASRGSSGSESVLGLPGAIDPCLLGDFDLKQFNLNDGFEDDVFGPDAFAWAGTHGMDVAMDGMTMDGLAAHDFQFNELPQDNQVQLGSSFLLASADQNNQPVQNMNQREAGQGLSDLVSAEPFGSRPFDLNIDYSQDTHLCDPDFETPSLLLDTTPGFSALPGGNVFMPEMSRYPAINQHTQIYPDPYYSMYPAQPYFQSMQHPYPQQYTGYVAMPIEYRTGTQQFDDIQPSSSRRSSRTSQTIATRQPSYRKRDRSDSGSDNDLPIVKRPCGQPTKRTLSSQDSRNHSEVSNTSSVSKPVKVAVVKAGEKPKKCDDKPWVRVNNTTRGETTRTARINQHAEEGRKYKFKDLPHGDWETSKYKFEYSQNNGMHEFKKRTMSARQIHEYTTQYPFDNLRIWIQPVASDVARRYASASHSHCRFEKCPMRVYTGKGTAEVGNYRVAFDEKHRTYGTGVADPYDCVGYAHLYCMERFLDFAYICQVADVKVDQRVAMEKEPSGRFGAAFGPKHHYEAALTSKFIEAASKGRLADTHEFSDYPVHEDYERGEPKPHERTLIYKLYGMNMKHRAKSQMKQFILQRKIRPGSFPVHRGDMEVKLVDKKIEKTDAFADFKRSGSKKEFDYAAYYDFFHPEIKQRIKECEELRDRFIAEDAAGTATKLTKARRTVAFADSGDEILAPRRKRSKKRHPSDSGSSSDERRASKSSSTKHTAAADESEDSDVFEEIGTGTEHHQPRRSSLRKKQRIDYSEPEDIIPQSISQLQLVNPMPGYVPAQPFDARKQSLSNLFPANNDPTWNNLDLEAFPADGHDTFIDEADIDALINAKYRRLSSTLCKGPSVSALRSPTLQRTHRTASFNMQPVSSSKDFQYRDPPSHVAASRNFADTMNDQNQQSRRSKRLASKVTPSSSLTE
ncbi:hypothetical protein G6011_05079 [Alternaria panax]|uniref:Uncharacterized protein n=1 Tax=Alternaria panax TaxID=48097 RepID=A0AAD4FC28_9PLEO|nr:hypothetical protein G6011_05079 [Alternaria panax]